MRPGENATRVARVVGKCRAARCHVPKWDATAAMPACWSTRSASTTEAPAMTAVAPAGGRQAPPRRDAHLRISALLPEGPWQWAAVAIAGLVLAPLLALAWTALQGGQIGRAHV